MSSIEGQHTEDDLPVSGLTLDVKPLTGKFFYEVYVTDYRIVIFMQIP